MSGPLFSVEVHYSRFTEARRLVICNLSARKVHQFRNQVFIDGVRRFDGPVHTELVPPSKIEAIDIWRQEGWIDVQEWDKDVSKPIL